MPPRPNDAASDYVAETSRRSIDPLNRSFHFGSPELCNYTQDRLC
jgi:hypothetical protein